MKFLRTSICWKQRNRRMVFIVLMAFILFAALSMVYLSYEVVRIPLKRNEFIDKGEISVLQERLLKLENELHKNRQFVKKLAQSVLPSVKSELGLQSKSEISAMKKFNLSNSSNFLLTCPIDTSPLLATSDFSIPNMYSEISFDNVDGGVWKQGWPITYDVNQWSKANKLRVFVVPHSHNDPGWIKTFENYYLDQTRYILDNMVAKLKEDPKRKMIWAEVSYLSLWWERASSSDRQEMMSLIHGGQIEIVTGGWVMNDEAVAHYFAITAQLIEGHEWLENHLNYRPESGWAIDPFGMSPTMAYLLKRMGLSHMVIQRVHYSVKKYLAKLKSLEFYWRQAWDSANVTDLFCHMMPFYSYDVPHTCGPDPKVCCQFDFKRLPGGQISCPWKIAPQAITPKNVEERAALLLDQYRKKAQLYNSNAILIPLGDDFRYDKASEWDQQYLNYQALFDFMNSKTEWNVKAQFGTLRDFFNAVEEEFSKEDAKHGRVEIPSLTGDFFTYADRDDHYWSGYYSSRPLYKNMDRILESYLRAGEILFSTLLAHLSQLKVENKFPTEQLVQHIVLARRNLGLFQHHDAIAGTAKDHVVIDYAKRMLQSINGLQTVIGKAAALLLSPSGEKTESSVVFDLDDNWPSHSSMVKKTVIDVTAGGRTVAFYNSLGRSRKELVSLLVSSPRLCVYNSANDAVLAQINPVWHGVDLDDDKYELNFVVDAPPLGFSTYVLKTTSSHTDACSTLAEVTIYNAASLPNSKEWNMKIGEASELSIENSLIIATFSSDGLLKSMTNKFDNHSETVVLSFLTYGTTHKKDKSGAYLFLPDSDATPITFDPPYFRLTKGALVSEVRTFIPNVEHGVQLRNSPGVDGLGLVVSNIIDITGESNTELVMRVKTGVSNFKTFYTDLNGLQMQRRIIMDKLPLQGNYYPVSAAMYIEDQNTRFNILSAQPLGGSSLQPGWLEFILDRRLNQDDNRGVQQPVLDNKITPSSFIFLMEKRLAAGSQPTGSPGFLSLAAHAVSHSLLYPILRLIENTESQSSNVAKKFLPYFTAMEGELPCDMHIVNLRTATSEMFQQDQPILHAKNYSILLLLHMGFDCSIYTPVLGCNLSNDKINLEKLFGQNFQSNITEVTLSGLYDFEQFSKSKTVLIPSMELNAYKLYR